MINFQDLKLSPALIKALEEKGYTTPSPIQEQAIPQVLEGRDVLGCAQTGTGKTAAFALPIIQNLMKHPAERWQKKKILSLILTPTRELALQIAENIKEYGSHTPINCTVIFGGVSQKTQVDDLRRGIDILVATPGRLNDLVNQKEIDLSHVEIFVLDEADRMLDMGFIHDVKKIIALLPKKRQTLLFSATMPSEIQELTKKLLHNPVKIEVTPVASTVDVVDTSLYYVDQENKRELLTYLLSHEDITSTLVFTRTKHGADRVSKFLIKNKVMAAAIHGDKSQGSRQRALADFKSGAIRVLVATDIAARGIDIEELSCVINFDLPNIPETYVHRIGRTGRAGLGGRAISFSNIEEKEYVKDIEHLIGKRIPVIAEHPFPMMIFTIVPKETRPRPTRKVQPKSRRI
ncbi:MAG: DEAD/DEAH box helicase [Hungatella sp.]